MGIIAACAPTLRPGWKWLLVRMKGRGSHQGHARLVDEVQLRPYGGQNVSMVTSKPGHRARDPEIGEAIQPPASLIQKTTRVDVDVGDRGQALREM